MSDYKAPPNDDSRARTVLLFSKDNLRNTTLIPRGGSHPRYLVSSAKDYSQTRITDAQGDVLAQLDFRTFMPDSVSFPATGRKAVRLAKWITSRDSLCVVFRGGK